MAPDHLLHLAWFTEHGRYWEALENLDWVAASLTLARAFHERGGRRMVMAGSCAEYDWSVPDSADPSGGFPLLVEDVTPCEPASLYGVCKHALHTLVSELSDRAGISAAWARIFFLYGPHEDPRRLVASVVRSLLAGEPAECTHGEQLRDFLHVADAGAALAALLDGEVEGPVNVASGKPVPLKEIVRLLGEHLRRGDLLRLGARPAPPHDPPILAADTTRLNEEVGWDPTIDLKTGLEATIDWWQKRFENGVS